MNICRQTTVDERNRTVGTEPNECRIEVGETSNESWMDVKQKLNKHRTEVGRMLIVTASDMTNNEATHALLRKWHYKSPFSSAMMAGDKAMNIVLQITQKFCNNGEWQHNECRATNHSKTLHRWWVTTQ